MSEWKTVAKPKAKTYSLSRDDFPLALRGNGRGRGGGSVRGRGRGGSRAGFRSGSRFWRASDSKDEKTPSATQTTAGQTIQSAAAAATTASAPLTVKVASPLLSSATTLYLNASDRYLPGLASGALCTIGNNCTRDVLGNPISRVVPGVKALNSYDDVRDAFTGESADMILVMGTPSAASVVPMDLFPSSDVSLVTGNTYDAIETAQIAFSIDVTSAQKQSRDVYLVQHPTDECSANLKVFDAYKPGRVAWKPTPVSHTKTFTQEVDAVRKTIVDAKKPEPVLLLQSPEWVAPPFKFFLPKAKIERFEDVLVATSYRSVIVRHSMAWLSKLGPDMREKLDTLYAIAAPALAWDIASTTNSRAYPQDVTHRAATYVLTRKG